MDQLDVLVVAALPEEHEAARLPGLAGHTGAPGIDAWRAGAADTATPYLTGVYRLADGTGFTVALARPTRMGATATAPVAASLAARLHPRCLAMPGVCA